MTDRCDGYLTACSFAWEHCITQQTTESVRNAPHIIIWRPVYNITADIRQRFRQQLRRS